MTTLVVQEYVAADVPARRASLPRRLVRGRPDDPAWVRPALLALLAGTAVLYLWGLGASGWANSFYSAAVEAGSKSWKAMFFGSFDSSNFVTVDKPPASLWVMDLSARVFGVNAWSILVPQALEGVAAVGLLYATVRRRFPASAALLAGGVLATTPVAVLMFRFNNPDALLVLTLVAAAYAMVRALEAGHTRWLVAAGVFIGLGFLTKMLQAVIVVPGFGLVYLYAAPVPLVRRLRQLAAGLVAMVVAAGWWVAAVTLTPASSRPYVGGSQHNSILELIFGYNGFGRLTGNETGSVGGGGNAGGRWGATGIGRMFGPDFGGQVSWLIPAALVLLAAMLWLSRNAPRIDAQRAQVLLWGSWLVVTGLTFSYAAGIIHPYYSVALAPAIGALVGIGAVSLWRHRHSLHARVPLAVALALTTWWAYRLLDRTPGWHPSLRWITVLAGLAASLAILAGAALQSRRGAAVVATVALGAALAGPVAYALDTASTAYGGAIPSAGPAGQGTNAFPGRPGGGIGPTGGPGGFGGGFGGPPPGLTGRPAFGGVQSGARGGLGGLLDAATPSNALVSLLRTNASPYTWVAATVGANSAAGVQLATGDAVMAIGGFNGTDPTPTLAQFQALVRAGKVHYFLANGNANGGPGGGLGGGPGGGPQTSTTSRAITAWVEATYTATTVAGVTVYDLTAG